MNQDICLSKTKIYYIHVGASGRNRDLVKVNLSNERGFPAGWRQGFLLVDSRADTT
jgi:hypothetical protein